MSNEETTWKHPDPIYKPKDEEELETQLMNCLKENGWKAERQVICEETKHWEHPWTADIICEKPSQGISPIGIELKYFKHHKSGSMFSKAFKQMWKYHNKTFNGSKIHTWILGTYFKKSKTLFSNESLLHPPENINEIRNKAIQENEEHIKWGSFAIKTVISGFLNNAGFGFLDLNSSELKIMFSGQGNNNHKILLFSPFKEKDSRSEKQYGNYNFSEIRKKCLEKQREFIKYIPRRIA